MKYVGRPWKSTKGGNIVVVVKDDGKEALLSPRLDLYRHSPDGFSWGYGGSGPAQLALAILCHHLKQATNERLIELKKREGYPDYDLSENPPTLERISWNDWLAIRIHQRFKGAVITRLPEEGFTLTSQQVEQAIEEITHDGD